MTDEEQLEFLAKFRPSDLLALDSQFEMWAAEGQVAPSSEGWRVWLMLAGRGFGKTRAGAEWIHQLAMSGGKQIALVGASIDDARAVMVEGVSGLLSVAQRMRVKVNWEPSLRRLTWPRGSVATIFSGDHAEGLRGPEHHFAWCDELAKWRQPELTWSNLQFGLRRGERPRALVTTTPKPLRLIETLIADRFTVTSGGKMRDNISLPARFLEVMAATYGGTRIGRQEMDGELMSEAEGSLWPRDLIERCRAVAPEQFDLIVVGVDPPAGSGPDCDACGIIVAGRAAGQFFVLADASIEGASPERWARAVKAAAETWNASLIVAEANQGGSMVESVLKAADAGLVVRLVHASRGKSARAEPVAIRFEGGKAWFAGVFEKLEAELSGLSAGGEYHGPGRSPDRADAMVWALTILGETRSGVPRVLRM